MPITMPCRFLSFDFLLMMIIFAAAMLLMLMILRHADMMMMILMMMLRWMMMMIDDADIFIDISFYLLLYTCPPGLLAMPALFPSSHCESLLL